jgi:allantoinase
MVHALRSRRVITPYGEQDATVVIEDGIITAVHPNSHLASASSPLASRLSHLPTEDLGSLALLPGLIDAHTHINEPGRTEWEGFATATRAAAAGGFTTLIDMPLNCLPETTNIAALELKREAAATGGPNGSSQCTIDYAFWGGCVDGNQRDLEPLALSGVAGFKSFLIYPGCDGFTAIDKQNLIRAIPHIARTGLPLLVHAELDPSINAAVAHLNATNADWTNYATYLASRPDEAELDAIEMLLQLSREALDRGQPFKLHIVHLSTARALPLIAAAKREGLPVTVETCPHFLHLTAETIPANPNGPTLCKSAPAIRSAANREQLWQALIDGTIDLIATDHSPCPQHMKRLHPTQQGEQPGRFDLAWGGIPSLSTALSVLWTECTRRELTLSQLAQWTSAAPASLAGLATHIGGIEPGKHANLVAFDPDAIFTLTPEMLHYRLKISPYLGETLRGQVRSTWLRGQLVFTRQNNIDEFANPPQGREHQLS